MQTMTKKPHKMNVLDLFSGLEGWSQAFKDRGHEVTTVDILSKFNPTIAKNIMCLSSSDLHEYGKFDVVLASPPCGCFSVASISTHWTGGKNAYIPKTENAKRSIVLVKYALSLIGNLDPQFWVLENPRGVLRKIIGLPKGTITYCQYGERRMKPTDLWGKIPESFIFKRCHNGDPCHDEARRGAKTGTQGIKSSEERAKIPYGLSLEICVACEKDLEE